MIKWKPGYAACLVVCGALVCAPAMAADGGQNKAHVSGPQHASANVQYHGVQVAIDPATGRLRQPTEADRKALSKIIKRDRALRATSSAMARPQTDAQARTTLRESAHGRVGAMMQVPESKMNYLMIEREADGSLSVHHKGDKPAAKVEEALK